MTTRPRRIGTRTLSTTAEPTEPVAPAADPPPPPPPPTERPRPRRTPTRRRWDQLERKEVRFRDDQVEALARLTRNLSRKARRARSGDDRPERITDNTLIRVAVDLLLDRADRLDGATEAELRRSVGLTS
jgi:type IV secretory pathway VirB10-like protein